MNNFEFDLRQLLKNAGLERKSVDQLAQPTSCGPVPQYRTHECKKPVRTDTSVKATRRSLKLR